MAQKKPHPEMGLWTQLSFDAALPQDESTLALAALILKDRASIAVGVRSVWGYGESVL